MLEISVAIIRPIKNLDFFLLMVDPILAILDPNQKTMSLLKLRVRLVHSCSETAKSASKYAMCS